MFRIYFKRIVHYLNDQNRPAISTSSAKFIQRNSLEELESAIDDRIEHAAEEDAQSIYENEMYTSEAERLLRGEWPFNEYSSLEFISPIMEIASSPADYAPEMLDAKYNNLVTEILTKKAKEMLAKIEDEAKQLATEQEELEKQLLLSLIEKYGNPMENK